MVSGERLAEVSVLEPGQMLHQAEQVRASRRHRTTQTVLIQALEPGQQRRPRGLELALQFFFHGSSAGSQGSLPPIYH